MITRRFTTPLEDRSEQQRVQGLQLAQLVQRAVAELEASGDQEGACKASFNDGPDAFVQIIKGQRVSHGSPRCSCALL